MKPKAKKKILEINLETLFALYIAIRLGDISIVADSEVQGDLVSYLLGDVERIEFKIAPISEELLEILEKVLTEDSKEILLDGRGTKVIELLETNKEKLRASLLCNSL